MDKQGMNMRLSCPNCGAQYEVPVEIIPQDGRDVQCSNCGHTWFQMHPDEDVELALETGASLPDEGWSPDQDTSADGTGLVEDPVDQPKSGEVQPPEPEFDDNSASQPPDAEAVGDVPPAPEPAAPADPPRRRESVGLDDLETLEDQADRREPEDHQDTPPELEPAPQSSPPQGTPRSAIDPSVADVLRQEAEYEVQVREAEARDLLETQAELGLDAPKDAATARAEEARARMRRIRGLPDTEDLLPAPTQDPQVRAPDMASRRDLLPDIEEINSTLRSTDGRTVADGDVVAISGRTQRRGGFRLGFGLMMLCAALVILAYVYNQDIVKTYPQVEPYMAQFMEKMNVLRVWLDTRVTEGMLWLDDKAASAGGNVD